MPSLKYFLRQFWCFGLKSNIVRKIQCHLNLKNIMKGKYVNCQFNVKENEMAESTILIIINHIMRLFLNFKRRTSREISLNAPLTTA